MRSSALTVFAGVAAAFCFASIFIHFAAGQFFLPLATLPLFFVLFLTPFREIWLALAASGTTLGILGFLGVFGPSTLISILISFSFAAALPALCAGAFYTTPLQTKDGATKWIPPEVPFIILCFLGLALFYGAVWFTASFVGNPLYTIFYEIAYPFTESTFEQLKALNPEINEETFNVADMAAQTTLRLSGLVVFMFIAGHYLNLLIAQWLLYRRAFIAMPLPRLGNFYFPSQFVWVVCGLYGVYLFGQHQKWAVEDFFLLIPALIALSLPLFLQGISTMHRVLTKRLVKVGVISVYLGLGLLMIAMTVQMFIIFTSLGIINNMHLYLQRKKHPENKRNTDET